MILIFILFLLIINQDLYKKEDIMDIIEALFWYFYFITFISICCIVAAYYSILSYSTFLSNFIIKKTFKMI